MFECVMCGLALTGRQRRYCGKNCSSRACKYRTGRVRRSRDFDPMRLKSFYESEAARRRKRLDRRVGA